jgi:hypothetical protein
MHLIRDLLDHRVIDRDGQIAGRVDGVLLDVPEAGPPTVAFLVIGGPTLFARIGGWAVAVSQMSRQRFGIARPAGRRIACTDIDHFGRDVRLKIRVGVSGAGTWESRIRRHVIDRIPGGSRK